jgi:Protein of unknown function (DUF1156)
VTYRKKLIEVALPLDAINAASTREKSIRDGHPSTLRVSTTAGGTVNDVPLGRTISLAVGTKIQFGKAEGEIRS